ncbi:metalloregulator ArsR/SmtB family transcription factor [Halorussus gelatinilyticus]|uniref:Metalloregulator ArsR/SmtB family transcription factor n=1 Tax=Halorussus gelatinilyticus TaxID=2937524 RepID=A0A8U0IJH2_9EURY|nr:metalloregulator ArsR/SmtB family transcription factor [Halorussus gelatinilyticus]UPW01173.1 metalloregulator ArsR/SmtB family transcription factor [Halorussus gelatinilyticus]
MDSAELLDILGNENRRRILRLLARKPCYVTEISEYLGVSPKAVIDHLRKLEDAGLVESRTDDQRRKYFSISRNLRLEVNVSPYEFGVKSAYPASVNLDASRWRYVSLNVQFDTKGEDGEEGAEEEDADATDADATDAGETEAGEIEASTESDGDGETAARAAELASELDELQQLQRELSLAQRWVHGRLADVQDRLGDALDGDGESRLLAEVLAAVAGGAATVGDVSSAVEVPERVAEGALNELAERGVLERGEDGEWELAE